MINQSKSIGVNYINIKSCKKVICKHGKVASYCINCSDNKSKKENLKCSFKKLVNCNNEPKKLDNEILPIIVECEHFVILEKYNCKKCKNKNLKRIRNDNIISQKRMKVNDKMYILK